MREVPALTSLPQNFLSAPPGETSHTENTGASWLWSVSYMYLDTIKNFLNIFPMPKTSQQSRAIQVGPSSDRYPCGSWSLYLPFWGVFFSHSHPQASSARCHVELWDSSLWGSPFKLDPSCWPSKCIFYMIELTECWWHDEFRLLSCQT